MKSKLYNALEGNKCYVKNQARLQGIRNARFNLHNSIRWSEYDSLRR